MMSVLTNRAWHEGKDNQASVATRQ